jgi:hypothetical protein
VAQAVETTGPELIVLPREGEPAPPGAEPPDLSDSTKLKAEVAAFMKRDQINDATAGEVADYKDYMGPQGFDPEQMGE